MGLCSKSPIFSHCKVRWNFFEISPFEKAHGLTLNIRKETRDYSDANALERYQNTGKGITVKRMNPAYLETVAKRVNGCPFFTLVSMHITNLDWGASRLEMLIEEKHLQPFGMVHGGVYASVVDAAAFWAVYPQIDDDFGITTIELKLNYLAPTSSGILIAKGKTIKVGKSLCLAEASVEDEAGKLLAHGTETMMVLKDLKLQGHEELPPKFL